MRGQKVIAAYKIPIIKQQNRALHIHVSGNLYFFVEEEFFRGYYRKSIVYKTKERAMEVYKLDKISWIERGALPFPSDG